MNGGLFRAEALAARGAGLLGSIRLHQPLRLRLLVLLVLVATLLSAAFLATASYARRTRVQGQLAPVAGLAVVQSPQAGVVSRVAVADGARVTQGELLLVIRAPRRTVTHADSLASLGHNLSRRRAELERARASVLAQQRHAQGSLVTQLHQAQQELSAMSAQIAAKQAELELQENAQGQWRDLAQQGYVSGLQWRQQQSATLALRSELQALRRQSFAIRRSVTQLRQAQADIPNGAVLQLDALDREMAALERERIELESTHEQAVAASVDGVVSAALVKVGESVGAGQQLLTLLPRDSRLQAELLVPSRAIGFVRPGDLVRLRYQSFPFQKFGHYAGTVQRVGRHALDPSQARSLLRGIVVAEPFYLVTVQLRQQSILAAGQLRALRPGMQLEADILGERRRLIEWLFEPLQSLRTVVAAR